MPAEASTVSGEGSAQRRRKAPLASSLRPPFAALFVGPQVSFKRPFNDAFGTRQEGRGCVA
jgi:hypothetical protein